jgi:signal transduction histidine kinase
LPREIATRDEISALILTPIFIGWVTWACISLSGLLKWASFRLRDLNGKLQQNQALLEQRIGERTLQLQESQAMLVQQEKQAAFGLLAAGIAHEVGNPLAAISSLVQLLNRRNIEGETREKLSLVDDQLRRIQRILRELVDFSRPALNQQTRCNIHETIDAALSIAKYYKRKKGKRILTHYAEEIPLMMIVRDQLVQVFLNLILNAMDATEEGGTIEIRTFRDNSWLRIDIRDDGQGVPEELRNRIFHPYFTTKATGTGLGLFVCRNIVEQNGGRIELTETSSTGTVFSVYFELPEAPRLSTTGLVSVAESFEISAWNPDRIFPSS